MLQTVFSYLLAILAIGFIILVHEGGHYLVARANGVGVNEFAIGFGPKIASVVWKGTRFSIKAIPFGGACVMRDEGMEFTDPEVDKLHDGKDDLFKDRPVWGRIAIIAAGPLTNLLLGLLCAFIVVTTVGVDLPIVRDVIEDFPAEEAGIMAGDEIVKMNNTKIYVSRQVTMYLDTHDHKPVDFTIRRDGELFTVTVSPQFDEEENRYYYGLYYNSLRTRVNPIQSLFYSGNEVVFFVESTLTSLSRLITGRGNGLNDLSGPVGTTQAVGEVVKEAAQDGPFYVFINLVNIIQVISVCLAIMNLLPLPALDGGRLIFLFFEAFTGKKVPSEKENLVHAIGILLLLLLSVVVMFNDIKNIFVK